MITLHLVLVNLFGSMYRPSVWVNTRIMQACVKGSWSSDCCSRWMVQCHCEMSYIAITVFVLVYKKSGRMHMVKWRHFLFGWDVQWCTISFEVQQSVVNRPTSLRNSKINYGQQWKTTESFVFLLLFSKSWGEIVQSCKMAFQSKWIFKETHSRVNLCRRPEVFHSVPSVY